MSFSSTENYCTNRIKFSFWYEFPDFDIKKFKNGFPNVVFRLERNKLWNIFIKHITSTWLTGYKNGNNFFEMWWSSLNLFLISDSRDRVFFWNSYFLGPFAFAESLFSVGNLKTSRKHVKWKLKPINHLILIPDVIDFLNNITPTK